jgi:hypothetical protein
MSVGNVVNTPQAVRDVSTSRESGSINSTANDLVSLKSAKAYANQPSGHFYNEAIAFFEKNPRATTYTSGNRTVTLSTLSTENNPTSVSSRIRLTVETKTAKETLSETNDFNRTEYKGTNILGLRFPSPFGVEITPVRGVTNLEYSNPNRD